MEIRIVVTWALAISLVGVRAIFAQESPPDWNRRVSEEDVTFEEVSDTDDEWTIAVRPALVLRSSPDTVDLSTRLVLSINGDERDVYDLRVPPMAEIPQQCRGEPENCSGPCPEESRCRREWYTTTRENGGISVRYYCACKRMLDGPVHFPTGEPGVPPFGFQLASGDLVTIHLEALDGATPEVFADDVMVSVRFEDDDISTAWSPYQIALITGAVIVAAALVLLVRWSRRAR